MGFVKLCFTDAFTRASGWKNMIEEEGNVSEWYKWNKVSLVLIISWGWVGYSSGSQSVVPRPSAAASPASLLEMQISGPTLKLTKSETLRVNEAQQFVFNNQPRWLWCLLKTEKTNVTITLGLELQCMNLGGGHDPVHSRHIKLRR